MNQEFSFSEENTSMGRQKVAANTGFARKLIGWGVVKTESQANMVLVALIVLGLGITFFNLSRVMSSPTAAELPPDPAMVTPQ